MSLVKPRIELTADLHQFSKDVFGSITGLVRPLVARKKDTLIIACSELGTAPDIISFGKPEQFLILQHLAASIPSKSECEIYDGLSCEGLEQLFDKYEFRHVIICGTLGCGVIPFWLQPAEKRDSDADIGGFRQRFEMGTRKLVDENYFPESVAERLELVIFEHVLCQIDNLLSHTFILDRVRTRTTSFYGWVIDDKSTRVYGYDPDESAFRLI